MKPGDSEEVHYHRFPAVVVDTEYQVRFGGLTSPVYELVTWIPPEVIAFDQVYHYPDYLGLPPRDLPNAGDVDAIEGTRVVFDVSVNKPLSKAEMVLESGRVIPLEKGAPLRWKASLEVRENDRFHLVLTDLEGDQSPFNPDYDVIARPDNPPEINVAFPFRDMEVNALAEIDFAFRVSDDYGLEGYGIRYQIAGREPVEISLGEGEEPVAEAEGRYQLELEKMALRAGDLVTWTVWARDQKPDRADYEIVGDPFFLEIRPFQRFFQEAVSNQGGMQGGGGEDPVALQKKVIIATWQLRRKLVTIGREDYAQDLAGIVETQVGVKEIVDQMAAMGGGGDPELGAQLDKALGDTLDALDAAVWPEPSEALIAATESAQTAYQLLLRMEPPRTQVARNRRNAAGGGGQQRDMSGMRELELERNRNFYEDEKRTREQQEAAAETLDKIRDLAQRQELINDEINRLVSELDTEEDREEIERRLESLRDEAKKAIEELDRIQREASSSEMDSRTGEEVRDQLARTREEMNRSLESLEPESLQQARSAGTRAIDELDNLADDLEEEARGSAAEQMAGLREEMDEIVALQDSIEQRMQALGNEKDSPRLTQMDPSQKAKNELLEEKHRLSEELLALMKDAADTANLARSSQELIARRLGDWVRETSKKGVIEDIDETSTLLENGVWESLAEKEAAIGDKLREAAEALERVSGDLVEDELEARERALGHLEDLESQIDEELIRSRVAGGGREGDDDRPGAGEEPSEAPAETIARAGNPDPESERGNREQADENGRPTGTRQSERGRPAGERGGQPSMTGGSGRSRPMSSDELMEMERFAEQDAREWIDRLETAEQLLPGESPIRERVGDIRREVEKMRRQFRRDNLIPRYDLYVDMVAVPLLEVTDALQRDIEARKDDRKILLRDDGDVPDQYRDDVSEYFRALSDSEGG